MPSSFRAFVVNKSDDSFETGVKELQQSDLPQGEVLIRVSYSGVNYKDGLACIPNGNIVRKYPFVPGIDLSGTVVESSDERFKTGDEVIVTSYNLGVSHYGGFSEYARVPADWVVPMPRGLNFKEAMIVGTAGFTAALAIHQLELNGLNPSKGPVLVTGATGGVGSMAISMLKNLGYTVAASTGKESEHAYLRELGASEILSREEVSAESPRPMEKERWAGSVDSVGGSTTTYLLRTTMYGCSVAACGLTGGSAVNTTIFPFILRGVNLLGIDSVACPMELRQSLWQRIGTDLKPQNIEGIVAREGTLDDLPEFTRTILKGGMRGRALVKL
ncbi:MAG TPA: acryloyl-CoA reductase [Chloroflexia bacterium]|nr:acryloyl-CoA reductase [Chloroflexia bacterium]